MDWVNISEEKPETNEASPSKISLQSVSGNDENEHGFYRALASLGLAATSPKHARASRDTSSRKFTEGNAHPASGNEELADDVVRLKRVSEEEEMERYFSGFSRA